MSKKLAWAIKWSDGTFEVHNTRQALREDMQQLKKFAEESEWQMPWKPVRVEIREIPRKK